MESFLDYRLFRIGESDITIGSLLVTLVILAVSYWLARLSRVFVAQRLLGRTRLDMGLRYAIGRILGYVIFFLGVLIALQTVGINATTLAVFGGALGIGLGFGLQDVVKNFVAGLIVLIERPVQVGDRIEIGEVSGDVVEIRARATVVRTNDDVHLIVPNSKFISDTVTNRSFGRKIVRYRVPVGVAYGSKPEAVKEALLAAAGKSESVLGDPVPAVWFVGFGDSSLDFELLCWTASMLHRPGAFASELNYLIHAELKAREIEIPFPQRDLHIRSAAALEPFFAERRGEDQGSVISRESARKLQSS
jgi:small-conductance mechanosensitive channel